MSDRREHRLGALPGHVRGLVLAVDLLAAAVVVWSVAGQTATGTQWLGLAVLAGSGLIHLSLTDTIERVRRWDAGPTLDLCGVWTFAGVVLLPLFQTTLLFVVLYVYQWRFTGTRQARRPPHRMIYTVATLVLAACGAGTLVEHTGLRDRLFDGSPLGTVDGLAVLAAITLAWIINTGLVGVVIWLTAGPSGALGGRTDNLLEIGQLMLGVFVAFGLARWPWFVLLMIGPVVMLHRTMLLHQLQQAARTDDKTGLLNAGAWRGQATAALAGTGSLAVFMIDLDHFAGVNNRYGHLAGDAVLRQVAHMLTASVRRGDTVGRFGGEEFAVLVPGVDKAQALAAADRIRRQMHSLAVVVDDATITGMTLSIGVAVHPHPPATSVDALLKAADSALYRAKHGGRDQVCSAFAAGESGM